jgi:hypothetical protein
MLSAFQSRFEEVASDSGTWFKQLQCHPANPMQLGNRQRVTERGLTEPSTFCGVKYSVPPERRLLTAPGGSGKKTDFVFPNKLSIQPNTV